jgi:hypothetical protein
MHVLCDNILHIYHIVDHFLIRLDLHIDIYIYDTKKALWKTKLRLNIRLNIYARIFLITREKFRL